jgi:hypothetical protein
MSRAEKRPPQPVKAATVLVHAEQGAAKPLTDAMSQAHFVGHVAAFLPANGK